MRKKVFSKNNIIYLLKHLLVAIFLVSLIEILKKYLKFTEPSHIIGDENIDFFLIIVLVIIFPVIEEIAFRLSIKKNNFFWLSILFCLLFLLTSKFIIIKLLLLIFIVLILINQFLKKNNLVVNSTIFLSALCFWLVHFDNYDKQKLLIMTPIDFFLLFFPQLLLAFILTKVRIQTFFANAVLLHIAYNFIILMLSFLFDT